MKEAKQGFARSLRSQNQGNRPTDPSVATLRTGGPSMAVPGEGGVARPPGGMQAGTREARSAANFGAPMSRFGGPSVNE